MLRRLVRNGIRDNARAGGHVVSTPPAHGGVVGTYCQDTVWPAASTLADAATLETFGRTVADLVIDSGADSADRRRSRLRDKLATQYPIASAK